MQSPFYFYHLFINVSGRNVKVNAADILMFQASGNYINVVTKEKNYLIRAIMNEIELSLLPQVFCRVHRSYIVSLLHIDEFTNTHVIVGKEHIPVQSEYAPRIFNRLPLLNDYFARN